MGLFTMTMSKFRIWGTHRIFFLTPSSKREKKKKENYANQAPFPNNALEEASYLTTSSKK